MGFIHLKPDPSLHQHAESKPLHGVSVTSTCSHVTASQVYPGDAATSTSSTILSFSHCWPEGWVLTWVSSGVCPRCHR